MNESAGGCGILRPLCRRLVASGIERFVGRLLLERCERDRVVACESRRKQRF